MKTICNIFYNLVDGLLEINQFPFKHPSGHRRSLTVIIRRL